ncbi:MAG: VPLPA-CTERM sorting domain-containing protein [Gammaproteobacteria bacterium]|nr:VPLPA-CTERM sorting domain-containing protein [Gammaproteobacteria bacterium]NNF60493.1 VPLPA-CTERM sorting domain-containing protein [Gammaproteobacteria bacterium]NNM20904.1 VPLPA-CTERM sorting domain-containing protein [Gammaproteobacteria bacterium]
MRKLGFILLALFCASGAFASTTGAEGNPPPWDTTVFVRGGFNDWGNGPAPTSPMTWDGASYSATIAIDAGTWQFKIADGDWGGLGGPNFGAAPSGGTEIFALGVASDIGANCCDNLEITLAEAGLYTFTMFNIAGDLQSADLVIERVIPVPAAGFLLLSALGGLGFLRRRT